METEYHSEYMLSVKSEWRIIQGHVVWMIYEVCAGLVYHRYFYQNRLKGRVR